MRPQIGDTQALGFNFVTAGSRGTFASGMAVVVAARKAIDTMRERAARQSRARSCPNAVIAPLVGRTIPQTAPISVVLPAPFGPSRAKISPLRIVRSTSSSALTPPE